MIGASNNLSPVCHYCQSSTCVSPYFVLLACKQVNHLRCLLYRDDGRQVIIIYSKKENVFKEMKTKSGKKIYNPYTFFLLAMPFVGIHIFTVNTFVILIGIKTRRMMVHFAPNDDTCHIIFISFKWFFFCKVKVSIEICHAN